MKRVFLLLTLLVSSVISAFSEADNGKFLPKGESFSKRNFYAEAKGSLIFPSIYNATGKYQVAESGYGANFGIGYNWGGWKIGLEATKEFWNDCSRGDLDLLKKLSVNALSLKIDRIISKNTIKFLPSWLNVVPGISTGIVFLNGEYYTSFRARDDGILKTVDFSLDAPHAFFLRGSFELAFNFGNDFFIPYIGGEYSMFRDNGMNGGFYMYPAAYVGIRTYPFASRKVRPKVKIKHKVPKANTSNFRLGGEKLRIFVDLPEGFTPDGDGVNDEIGIYPLYVNASQEFDEWKISVCDKKNVAVSSWTGKGVLPKKITWDGTTFNNENLYAFETYSVKIEVSLNNPESILGYDMLVSEQNFKTGLIVQSANGSTTNWKLVVNELYFDSDDSTFDRVSEAKKKQNKNTLDFIAEQIDSVNYKRVYINAYANNYSGTAEENTMQLIPLTQKRADVILRELSKRGIDPQRMIPVGKGGSDPIAPYTDRQNWWKNIRIEFIIEN